MKDHLWLYFLVAILINSAIGFVIGGYPVAGKFAGQTFFYGGIITLVLYVAKFLINSSRKDKNLILKD